jgi:GxxExxY protein
MNENELSKLVIGISMKVHNALRPGLLENVYKECLFYKLQKEGLFVERKKDYL